MPTGKRICYKVSVGSPIDIAGVKANCFYVNVTSTGKTLIRAKSDGTIEDSVCFSDNAFLGLEFALVALFPVAIEQVPFRTLQKGDRFILHDDVDSQAVNAESEVSNQIYVAVAVTEDSGPDLGTLSGVYDTLLAFPIFPYLDSGADMEKQNADRDRNNLEETP